MSQQTQLFGIQPPLRSPTVLNNINLRDAQVPVLQGPSMRQQTQLFGIRPPLHSPVLIRNINLHESQVPVLRGPSTRQQTQLFGIQPPLCSPTLGAEQEQQELRQLSRILQQGDNTEFTWV